MAPRPFLVSGGAEDPPTRWTALNHTIAVNQLLGVTDRVAMTNRKEHTPRPRVERTDLRVLRALPKGDEVTRHEFRFLLPEFHAAYQLFGQQQSLRSAATFAGRSSRGLSCSFGSRTAVHRAPDHGDARRARDAFRRAMPQGLNLNKAELEKQLPNRVVRLARHRWRRRLRPLHGLRRQDDLPARRRVARRLALRRVAAGHLEADRHR